MIPAAEEIQNQNGEQSENVKSPRRRRRTKEAVSITAKELREWYMVQQAVGVYKDVREKSSLVRSMADKMEETSQAIGHKIINTRSGRKADRLLAPVARKAHQTAKKCVDFASKQTDKPVQTASTLFHAAFRYWPPTLLTRWGVDATLGVSSAALALMKDVCSDSQSEAQKAEIEVVYSQFVPEKKVTSSGDGSPTKYDDSPKKTTDAIPPSSKDEATETEGENPEESMVAMAGDSSYCSIGDDWDGYKVVFGENSIFVWMLKATVTTLNIMLRLTFGIFMPLITVFVLMLCRFSNQLHRWAGLSETAEEHKERVDLYDRLFDEKNENIKRENSQNGKDENAKNENGQNGNAPNENGQNGNAPNENAQVENIQEETKASRRPGSEWLFDAVVDYQVGRVMKFYFFDKLLDIVGLQRPVKIAEEIAVKFDELKSQKAALVKYLEDDPDYDENDDPDYEPTDDQPTEDSLEYKDDDELEPDTGTDNDSKDKKNSPRRNTTTRVTAQTCSTPKEAERIKGTPTKKPLGQVDKHIFPLEFREPLSPLLSPLSTKDKSPIKSVEHAVTRVQGENPDESGSVETEKCTPKKAVQVTVEINENTKLQNGFYVKDDLTDGANDGGHDMAGTSLDRLFITPETSFQVDTMDVYADFSVEDSKQSETEAKENSELLFELMSLAKCVGENVINVDDMQEYGKGICDEDVDSNVSKEVRIAEVDNDHTEQVVELGKGHNKSPDVLTNSMEHDSNVQDQTSPKVRDGRGIPGMECRDSLDLDDGRHSSNVDTGQAVSGW